MEGLQRRGQRKIRPELGLVNALDETTFSDAQWLVLELMLPHPGGLVAAC